MRISCNDIPELTVNVFVAGWSINKEQYLHSDMLSSLDVFHGEILRVSFVSAKILHRIPRSLGKRK